MTDTDASVGLVAMLTARTRAANVLNFEVFLREAKQKLSFAHRVAFMRMMLEDRASMLWVVLIVLHPFLVRSGRPLLPVWGGVDSHSSEPAFCRRYHPQRSLQSSPVRGLSG